MPAATTVGKILTLWHNKSAPWLDPITGGGGHRAAMSILFFGESNSGGAAPNADATAAELAPRPQVRILNNTTLASFDDLDIGTNNMLGHAGLSATTLHGCELELANAVSAGRFATNYVNLVKTGQGASRVDEWVPDHPSGYWTTFLARVQAARSLLGTFSPVVLYSQGINDHIGYSYYDVLTTGSNRPAISAADWKTATISLLAQLRAELGSETLIVMTKFKASAHATYNVAIDEIAAADPYTVTIQTAEDLWQVDNNHWTYTGYKSACELFIDEAFAANGQSAQPTFSPPAGEYEGDQSVEIVSPGTVKYVSDAKDPHIGAVYTGAITVTPPGTIWARAIERAKKASEIATAVYVSGTRWSAADASAGSLILSNSDRTVAQSTTAWKSIRATKSLSSGKVYFELACASGTNETMIIGLASSGFALSSYLGTSAYSVGYATNAQYKSGFTGTVYCPSGRPGGHVYAIAVDFTDGKVWIGKDNVWAGSGDPAAGSNPASTFTPATVGALFPALSIYNVAAGGWTIRTASADQAYAPPTGFSPWN